MHVRRTMVVVGAVGGAVLGGQALAASPGRPSAGSMKQPRASIANVRGLRLIYGYVVIANPTDAYGDVTPAYSVAVCPRGLHALSGGWNSSDTTTDPVTISSNEAGRGLTRWIVVAEDTAPNSSTSSFTFEATAMCG